MNLPQPTPSTSLSMKRNKKPILLFGLFRKGKEDPSEMVMPFPSKSQPLGSGVPSSAIPVNSIEQRLNDPYTPSQYQKQPNHAIYKNPLFSPQYAPPQYHQPPPQRRQRSKSVGRDASPNISRLLEERENALSKLCGNSSDPTSLAESLPLLSPTYNKTIPPPVPPIPLQHQPHSPTKAEPSRPTVRKFPSAHDIRKVAKLQQDSIQQASIEKMPMLQKVQPKQSPNMTRSRSASTSSPRHKLSPPPVMSPPLLPKQFMRHQLPVQQNDDDDDIPLGFLQSPVSRPSSLLSDQDDEDDKDLVPIAALTVSNSTQVASKDKDYQTAADKYKERVKERLHLDKEDGEEDDDDIPISLALLSFKDKAPWRQ